MSTSLSRIIQKLMGNQHMKSGYNETKEILIGINYYQQRPRLKKHWKIM